MRKFCLITAATLAAVGLAAAQPAAAKGPGWKTEKGNPHSSSYRRKLGWASVGRQRGWSQARKGGWLYAQVPPGWSRWPD